MQALARATSFCARCSYLADSSDGTVNYCPKCGAEFLPGPARCDEPISRPSPLDDPERIGAAPGSFARPGRDDERSYTAAWIGHGQVIAERYRLIELLGEGGMGAVFKAEHVRMGKALAVKLLRGTFARDPLAVARFRAEAQIVSRLCHPHTIAVFDFGEIGEEGFYLAMEYVPGRNLAALLAEHGTLDEERAIGIAEQILGALAEAHEAGVVHRDVKPANVVVVEAREGDFVKVLDFGIAKLREPDGVDTTAGAVLGTPSYLAPEQARGVEVDGRADLYAVGAILYELVSGRPPYVGDGPLEVLAAHLREPLRPLHEVAPGVSRQFEDVVHRALAKLPEGRFESAHAMREALLATPGGAGARPRAPGPRSEGPWAKGGRSSQELARRADFEELEHGRRFLGGGRAKAFVAALAALLVAVGAAATWRWADVYAVLARRAPRVAASLAPSLRPNHPFDGAEHEPNDVPSGANPLVFPVNPAGAATVRGRVGEKIDSRTGDVDVFRLVVPESRQAQVLVAEWFAEGRPEEGIRGLDVKLTLNRDEGGPGGRRPAPLVTQGDRGGPDERERLAAMVAPGTYYLAVRETHPDSNAPVERPADAYLLKVWLEEPRPGEELEPNDEPALSSGDSTHSRFEEWRALAKRNQLGEGDRTRSETSEDDPDTFAVEARRPRERPELVLLLPEPSLALTAQLWIPDAEDLASRGGPDRVRFAEAGEGEPGEVLVVKLPSPAADAPALLRVRAVSGDGRYEVLSLGNGSASARPLLALIEAAAEAATEAVGSEGGPGALETSAAFARMLPAAQARDEVLLAAGRLAEKLAGKLEPEAVPDYERVARSLGRPPFLAVDGKVRYSAAFELLVAGAGPSAEEAQLRAVLRALPCTPAEVAGRAKGFLARFPRSRHARQALLALARAQEDRYFETGNRVILRRALWTYRALASRQGRTAAEARDRVRALSHHRPEEPAVPRTQCE
jgi:serine/threonine-protein kinase